MSIGIRAAAFQKIDGALKAGESIDEWRVNRFIREEFEKAGLVTDHGPIVGVNANMSDPHYEPATRRGAIPFAKRMRC